ncbi:MAG: ATP-binding protein [Magnetococcales bacterium]|nr:ATP-binding protein [Magnetococcales bacterium]
MKLGIRGKLFLTSLFLVLVVILSTGIYLASAMGEWLESRIASQLQTHATTGRSMVQAIPDKLTKNNVDPVADLLGRDTQSRITVIAKDGTVMGDSRLDGKGLLMVENHGMRPEVLLAHKKGLGISKRFSNTLRIFMLYIAIPYDHPGGGTGVVRAAMSVEEVSQIQSRMRWIIFLAGLISVIIAISMAALSAHLTTRTLRQVLKDAQKRAEKIGIKTVDRSDNDEIHGLIVSVGIIVEELEKTLGELAGERSRLEAVLEGMDDGVVALDQDFKVTLINRSAQSMLDISGKQRGRKLHEIIKAPHLDDLLNSALSRENRTSQCLECTWQKSAQQYRIMINLIPMRDQPGWILVFHDVTEIRRLESVRQDFVANVSHELRTPISVVQANSQTLLNGAIRDEKYAPVLIEAIERNAQRLTAIISDLLELSLLEVKQDPLNTEKINLLHVVEGSLDLVMEAFEDKKLKIQVSIPNNLHIQANLGALNKVLNNLLDNAVKYNSNEATIKIRAIESENFVKIEVEDNGSGISKEHQTRVFERFYRVDTGRSRKMGGTGLGLSLVKHLVEKMGGEVGLDSLKPNGCLFWFTIPRYY